MLERTEKTSCTKIANPTRTLEHIEQSMKILEETGEGGVGDAGMETRRGHNVDVHVDSDWTKGPERKSSGGGTMMISGTVVKHWSRAADQNAVDDEGLGTRTQPQRLHQEEDLEISELLNMKICGFKR